MDVSYVPRADSCTAANDVHGLAYSITSSARPSSVSGNERPSRLAVLRLMISSIFVDWKTGSSAGFSPLRELARIDAELAINV